MMLSVGESPMWVANQMGHTDWTMISRVYGKWLSDAQPDAGQKTVETFAGNRAEIVTKRNEVMPKHWHDSSTIERHIIVFIG